jgi:rhamnosyltransferase
MNKKPLVSIIIRTKNEEQWIDICLKNIFNQSFKNFEVIIVDNLSKDKTIQKAKKYPVKFLKISKFYPGKALNDGAKKAKGKYIVCLSAHCIPEDHDWLKNLILDFKFKKVAAVYGRQLPLPYSSDFDKRDLYNTFGLEKKIQNKDNFFHNANSAIKKELWKKYPFDEKIEHIEDRIWANKIINLGYKIIYQPKASVYHWHGINQDMNPERCASIVKILEDLNQNNSNKKIDSTINKNLICIGVIPQRGESIIFNKNKKEYLIKFTIEQMKSSKYLKQIYVATDNKKTKDFAEICGAIVPFLRPKNLSASYVDLFSVIKFFINKLEKNFFSDYVLIATENFPFRKNLVFDLMIKKSIKNDYDLNIAIKKEDGSIFSYKNKIFTKIVDGFLPKNYKNETVFKSRIGYACVVRTSALRAGFFRNKKIGYHEIKDEIGMVEVNNDNIQSFQRLFD